MDKIQHAPYLRQLKILVVVSAIVAVITLGMFLAGTSAFVSSFSIYGIPILAIINAAMAIFTWNKIKDQEHTRNIFGGFSIAFTLWAIAEALWMIFVLLNLDPYPSLADVFWAVGYIPLILALVTYYRSFQAQLEKRQVIAISVTVLAIAIVFLNYILIPIVQDFSLDRLFESFFNLLYPSLDIIVLFLAMYLLIVGRKSRFNVAWTFIAIGFGATSLADLGFASASWYGLYFPEETNLLSRMIDWGYLLGYLALASGAFSYLLAFKLIDMRPTAPAAIPPTAEIPNTYYLIITDTQNQVIDMSNNFLVMKAAERKSLLQGLPLSAVLGLDTKKTTDILTTIQRNGQNKEVSCQIRDPHGNDYAAKLSGIAIYDTEKRYQGANLLIQTRIPGGIPYKDLNPDEEETVKYISTRCGLPVYPYGEILRAYFSAYILLLYSLLVQHVGEPVGLALITFLSDTAIQNRWEVKMTSESVWVSGDYAPLKLLEILPRLLGLARYYVFRLIGVQTVSEATNAMESQMDTVTLTIAKDFGLRRIPM